MPDGTALIPGGEPAYIVTTTLTVGQYVHYLQGTGQDVPVKWQDVLPGSPEAQHPIVGLTRAEARRCAVWLLKRLPTPDEWARAAEIVRARPYPWKADGSPVSPDAEVFLVISPGDELKARRERDGLADAILEEYVTEINALAERVRGELAAERMRRKRAWDEVKPAFFALLEEERNLAQQQALRTGRAEAVAVVEALVTAKARLAVKLATGDPTAEEADAEVAGYSRQLAEARAQAQQVREKLQQALNAAQQQVVGLSEAYEQRGASRIDQGLDDLDGMIAAAVGPPETIALAAAAKLRLEAVARRLQEAAASASSLPALEELKQQAARVKEQLGQLAPDDAVERMKELRAKMAEIGKAIEQEFLQEKELFTDLEGLIDLRARKEAAEARLARLKDALARADAGEAPAAP
jgi:hypothetical protein